MGIVFRQSVKSTIVTFAGALLGALLTYAGTRLFTMQELGIIRILITISAVFQSVILLGGGSVLATFLQRYSEKDVRKKTLLTITCVVPVVVVLISSIFYYLLKEPIIHIFKPEDQPFIAKYYHHIPIFVLAWGYMSLFDLYLVAQHKTAVSAFVREIVLRVINAVLYLLFFYSLIRFHTIIAGIVCMYIASAVILFIISSRTKGFGFSFQWNAFSKKEYKDIIHFAWYHLLLNVTFYMMGYIDTLMLAPLDKSGIKSVAVYTIATFIISIMIIPYRAMTLAAYPTLNQAYIDKNEAHVKDLFNRSSINILTVGVAMFLLIGCNLHNAVRLLPPGYEATSLLVFILMLGRLVDMSTGLNNELISISKYYKFNFRVSLLLIILIFISNRILIPIYGVYGAAWGSTLSLCVFNFLKVIYLRKKFGINTFSRNTFLICLLGLVSFACVYWLPKFDNLFIDTAFRTVIVLAIYATLLFIFKPSQDLSSYLASIKKNKRLF